MTQKRAQQIHHQQQQQQQQQREIYQQLKEHQHQQQQQQHQQDTMPQNLSRRLSTISTTSVDTAMSSSPMSQYSPALYNLQMSFLAAASQGRMPTAYPFLSEDASTAAAHLSHEINTSMNNNNSGEKLPMMKISCSDDYGDDLQSRKRRWSAPDIEEEQQQLQHQHSQRKIVN